MSTKEALVNGAYARGKISGLTSSPTPEDIQTGLRQLENMAREFFARNIDVGYYFEDSPATGTPHNIPVEYWDAFECNLAIRLLYYFGKEPMAYLAGFAQSGFSFLSGATAPIRQVSYPARHPIGSGNARFRRTRRFYAAPVEAPLSAETIKMTIGDINIFTEHFDEYLRDSETIASYTLTADDGLTVTNDSLTTPDITYTVEAVGVSDSSENGLQTITIVATTSAGRVETREINFELS